jgi:hypothetical protein
MDYSSSCVIVDIVEDINLVFSFLMGSWVNHKIKLNYQTLYSSEPNYIKMGNICAKKEKCEHAGATPYESFLCLPFYMVCGQHCHCCCGRFCSPLILVCDNCNKTIVPPKQEIMGML